MSDTFFTAAPHWTWWIVLYFFVGGIAGTAFFLAAMLDLTGRPADRPTARLGYYVAFIGALISGFLLTVDLDRPLRFWHMMIESNTGQPMFKSWVPMSVGVWGLLLFGLFSFLAALASLGAERERPPILQSAPVRFLRRRGPSIVIAVLGSVFGLFLAGYTGVLMVGTVAPVWHNAVPLGGLFLASALSTSYALLILLLARRGRGHSDPTVAKLALADRWALAIEIVLLLLVLVPLGALARPMLTGGFGVVFWIGVVLAGLIAPFVLEFAGRDVERKHRLRAILVLAGGLMLRFVIIMAPQWPGVKPWSL
jgi:formate-dependent nitrite reductase membrane component NrfD